MATAIPIPETYNGQWNQPKYGMTMPRCFPVNLSIISGKTETQPAKKIPVNTLLKSATNAKTTNKKMALAM